MVLLLTDKGCVVFAATDLAHFDPKGADFGFVVDSPFVANAKLAVEVVAPNVELAA